jgi:hypothetical protein
MQRTAQFSAFWAISAAQNAMATKIDISPISLLFSSSPPNCPTRCRPTFLPFFSTPLPKSDYLDDYDKSCPNASSAIWPKGNLTYDQTFLIMEKLRTFVLHINGG